MTNTYQTFAIPYNCLHTSSGQDILFIIVAGVVGFPLFEKCGIGKPI